MKFTTHLKASVISAGIFAGALCITLPTVITNKQCQSLSNAEAVQQCLQTSQQSWLNWFQGKSRSTQFHFVDLLELLNRVSPTQKP